MKSSSPVPNSNYLDSAEACLFPNVVKLIDCMVVGESCNLRLRAVDSEARISVFWNYARYCHLVKKSKKKYNTSPRARGNNKIMVKINHRILKDICDDVLDDLDIQWATHGDAYVIRPPPGYKDKMMDYDFFLSQKHVARRLTHIGHAPKKMMYFKDIDVRRDHWVDGDTCFTTAAVYIVDEKQDYNKKDRSNYFPPTNPTRYTAMEQRGTEPTLGYDNTYTIAHPLLQHIFTRYEHNNYPRISPHGSKMIGHGIHKTTHIMDDDLASVMNYAKYVHFDPETDKIYFAIKIHLTLTEHEDVLRMLKSNPKCIPILEKENIKVKETNDQISASATIDFKRLNIVPVAWCDRSPYSNTDICSHYRGDYTVCLDNKMNTNQWHVFAVKQGCGDTSDINWKEVLVYNIEKDGSICTTPVTVSRRSFMSFNFPFSSLSGREATERYNKSLIQSDDYEMGEEEIVGIIDLNILFRCDWRI